MSLMMQGIYMSAAGGVVQEERLYQTSNNIANLNTSGYKKDTMAFRDWLPPYGAETYGPKTFPPFLPVTWSSLVFKDDKLYPYTDEIRTDFSQGNMEATQNPLDLAIEGEGFYAVQTPGGVRYTRDGNFSINSDDMLVTAQGLPVLGEKGPIKIDGEDVTISRDGVVMVDKEEIDKLKVVRFSKLFGLKKVGDNLFENIDPEQNPAGEATNFTVRQGFLELANVNGIKEMLHMIELMRAYETQQRAMTSQDQINGRVVNDLARV
ncbi:MAG: flagellar basal-body rod protein FlgF [Nitrospirae bacterium]|nr:flagellar basal-body rod protein FlgF [Nitrospirota bacterium]